MIEPDEMATPPLGEELGSRALTVTVKGALGTIPFLGSVLAEIAGQTIPHQRFERVEDYLRHLQLRVDALDEALIREHLKDPERIDLIEDGAEQATRALSDGRREYIAKLVAEGICGEDKAKIEAKRMLRLLRDLDDDQVIILTSYSHH